MLHQLDLIQLWLAQAQQHIGAAEQRLAILGYSGARFSVFGVCEAGTGAQTRLYHQLGAQLTQLLGVIRRDRNPVLARVGFFGNGNAHSGVYPRKLVCLFYR